MSESELIERCGALAQAGDKQAAATLKLVEERDQLKALCLAEAERVAVQSALLTKQAEAVQAEAEPAAPAFDGNTPMVSTRAGRRVNEGGTQGP